MPCFTKNNTKALMFAILQALMLYAKAQSIITTIVGTGVAGYNGDNIIATTAQLNNPAAIIFDSIGNYYITDESNNRIRKISTLGIVTTIAGGGIAGYSGDGGPATVAEINTPDGIAIDKAGNIFFSDFFNNRIRKINTNGIISTIAGTGTLGYNGDGGQATAAELNAPLYITIDDTGNIYFGDNNIVVRKINTAGIITTIAGTGVSGYSGDGGQATNAELDSPGVIVFDDIGNLYFTDEWNNVVRKIDTAGIITTIAGTGASGYSGDGGIALAAELNVPFALAFDKQGNLYIGDDGNNRIRKVSNVGQMAGIATLSIGEGLGVRLYPNPNAGSFTISYAGSGNQLSIEIYNTIGSLIISNQLSLENNTISTEVNNLETGVYMVKLSINGIPVKIERVIVTK